MRPVFADPKTDFVFKRIFGSEVRKPLLIELLNALLELEGDQDARGALRLAERVGVEKGMRKAIRAICQAFETELDADREATLAGMGTDELDGLHARLLSERRWT